MLDKGARVLMQGRRETRIGQSTDSSHLLTVSVFLFLPFSILFAFLVIVLMVLRITSKFEPL